MELDAKEPVEAEAEELEVEKQEPAQAGVTCNLEEAETTEEATEAKETAESFKTEGMADTTPTAEAEEVIQEVTVSPKRGKAFMGVVFEYLQSIGLAFLIAMIIMAFLGRSYMVEGASMENTLFNNERVLVEKISYYVSSPDRGDIVVLMNPRQAPYDNWFANTFGFVKDIFVSNMSTRPYIKRIIGVAGDTIEVKTGKVYLNGVELVEPYMREEIWWDYGPYTVPDGYVFVMGDNRNHSDDSRGSVGLLEIRRILGKAVVRFWPVNKIAIFTKPDIFKGK
jgi:signal peptidase I